MVASIAEFRLPTEGFCLAETLPVTDASFQFLQLVAHDPAGVLPFVRATGDERTLAGLDELFAADPTVESAERIAAMSDGHLYHVEWADSIEEIVHALLEEGATILDATTMDEQWQLQALFHDRDSLSRTYERCEGRGLSVTVDRIYELTDVRHQQFGLTTQQHETMLAALEHGYYDVPREASLTDLAESLDVSHQALSERLRRGHGNLVKHALGASKSGEEEVSLPTGHEESVAASED